MILHFVIGPFGEGRERFSKFLNNSLKETGFQSRLRNCGSLSCLDNYGGIDALTLDFCLEDIEFGIENVVSGENLVFTGAGLSLYIKDIIKEYPSSRIYIVKNLMSKLDKDQTFIENLLMSVSDLTEDWIYQTNAKIKSIIDEFEKDSQIVWHEITEINAMVAQL